MTEEVPMNYDCAASYLGVATGTLRNYVFARKISAYKAVSGTVYFKRADLDKFAFHKRVAASFEVNEQAESLLNR